jgi:hypothetical protein
MKIEAGKQYITKHGVKTSKLKKDTEGYYGLVSGYYIQWYDNGIVRGNNYSDLASLVREYKEPKIECCYVCGEPIIEESVIGKVHENRPANDPNKWRTVGPVHKNCEPLLEFSVAFVKHILEEYRKPTK